MKRSSATRRPSRRQRGAALLMAMLTVTLVATFAAASLWQQWRSVEVEAAERSRVQSSWVLTGALDWARLILREDARSTNNGNIDHLGEPWAVPLQESRLSTFLAADRDHVGDPNDDVDAFLSGQIIDLQSRMNVNSLVDGSKISPAAFESFSRLFEQLNLPPQELSVMAENLRLAAVAAAAPAADAAAAGPAPLLPQRAEQLGWLGLSPASVVLLQPFVTVLPAGTRINANTASIEVLQASIPGLGRSGAQKLATTRARSPFRTLADVQTQIGEGVDLAQVPLVFASGYFEVEGRLRLGPNTVIERSIVQRVGLNVVTIWRERAASNPAAALAALR
jgi:general secretion pathway protein K